MPQQVSSFKLFPSHAKEYLRRYESNMKPIHVVQSEVAKNMRDELKRVSSHPPPPLTPQLEDKRHALDLRSRILDEAHKKAQEDRDILELKVVDFQVQMLNNYR